jgi:gentisate 1,2-dioxygenase
MSTVKHETANMADAQARRALKDDLDRLNVRVHQPDDPPLFTRDPQSSMVPLHWRWS